MTVLKMKKKKNSKESIREKWQHFQNGMSRIWTVLYARMLFAFVIYTKHAAAVFNLIRFDLIKCDLVFILWFGNWSNNWRKKWYHFQSFIRTKDVRQVFLCIFLLLLLLLSTRMNRSTCFIVWKFNRLTWFSLWCLLSAMAETTVFTHGFLYVSCTSISH